MPGLSALPVEVLAIVLAKLPPREAIQLQPVSRNFRCAAAAGEELAGGLVDQLLKVLSAGLPGVCVTVDGQSGRAALAACAARRWLARSAAGAKVLCCHDRSKACVDIPPFKNIPAHMSLVSCLPALEVIDLCLSKPLIHNELVCLLEALSWLPHLQALLLSVDLLDPEGDSGPRSAVSGDGSDDDESDPEGDSGDGSDDDESEPCPDLSAFAQLRSLTRLALSFNAFGPYTLAGVVGALVPLTGLADLNLSLPPASTVVPAALGQLKALRSLVLSKARLGGFEAGCLELPNLVSLKFHQCTFAEGVVLSGATALQSLTSMEFSLGEGPRFFDHQLVQLPRLQRMVFGAHVLQFDAALWMFMLPADMGSLGSSLLHLKCSGIRYARFPLPLTQLVALEHLDASYNRFACCHNGPFQVDRAGAWAVL